jgi:diguanylate cyclase (GGDEF)-like protein
MGHGTALTLGLTIVPGLTLGGSVGLALGALVALGAVLALGVVGWQRVRAARHEAAAAARRATRADRLAAADPDPVFVVGRDGAIQDRNAAAETLLAATAQDDAVATSLTALVNPADVSSLTTLLQRAPADPAGRLLLRGGGESGAVWEATAISLPPSEPAGEEALVLRLRDVGDVEALRAELAALSLHDPVTGLPSRTLFMDRLGHALALAARRAEVLGVFVVDTDLSLAGALAEAARDEALATIAPRLRLALRHGDSVARLDETRFAILLEALHDVLDAAAVAERLLDRFHSPVAVAGQQVSVVPMIGMALSGGHERPDELLAQAEAALAAVRRGPFAPYAIYDPSMTIAPADHAGLEHELRRAFAADELSLHFQPVVRLSDERVVAYEATPVWQHPRRGPIATAELTGTAEANGLMLPLGLWSLVNACRQLVAWTQQGDETPPLVCLDVSRRMFHHTGLAGDVARVLHEAGLRPPLLRLAIPQSLALADVDATVARLQALQGVGVQVAISEFGTGYAALGFLQRCPVDCLKIASTYVAGLGHNPDDSAIVKAALVFAKGLEIPVVAEGVETIAQRDELRRLDCAFGQGGLFGPPVPPGEIPVRPAVSPLDPAGLATGGDQPAMTAHANEES